MTETMGADSKSKRLKIRTVSNGCNPGAVLGSVIAAARSKLTTLGRKSGGFRRIISA